MDAPALPKPAQAAAQKAKQLLALEARLLEKEENLPELLADKDELDEDLKRLRTEVAEANQAAAEKPDAHDYSKGHTRDYFIDLLEIKLARIIHQS